MTDPGLETTAPPAEGSTRESRAAQQRSRILDAAQQRFIESGFHAASMADIASTAGMSPGLIYRYFDNKSAIVRAIIERHLERDGCRGLHQVQTPGDICWALLELFEHWRLADDPNMNAAMYLELAAESSRDPEIARAVRAKDHVIGEAVMQALRRVSLEQGVTLSTEAIRGRAMMLQCLVEGLASRTLRDPDLTADTLRPALERVIEALLAAESRA